MDYFKKGPPHDFFEFEKKIGKMMRNMSHLHMPNIESERWFPAADVYESDVEIIVYVDISGVDMHELSVVAEQNSLIVSGERRVFIQDDIKNIHQLEIERGYFKRTISLPASVDVTKTSSTRTADQTMRTSSPQ